VKRNSSHRQALGAARQNTQPEVSEGPGQRDLLLSLVLTPAVLTSPSAML